MSGRTGKRSVSGDFSPEVGQSFQPPVFEKDTSLQTLNGEAFDDLLVKYGRHPFGDH